jgi:hypothetical protein
MSSALDITRAVNPPRTAFLDYPLGHTTGKPKAPALQREILLDALSAFGSLDSPGSVKILSQKWDTDEDWKVLERTKEDDRMIRDDTPQYQHEEDRYLVESGSPDAGEIHE